MVQQLLKDSVNSFPQHYSDMRSILNQISLINCVKYIRQNLQLWHASYAHANKKSQKQEPDIVWWKRTQHTEVERKYRRQI